ncbi:hypothetical protein [Pyxidicoccus xibeiensis]|uniref:hypothetical protein n=1 Tax=Pyxidicoccus xibeiensis TaxID=2906759 RepID=UPI0020A77EB7|nr:hypothetical protein [Pyxidicoccus xibeiensis]MCP3136217.1 hypothetical protein [Pyxidicoccus xibeiensis]
MRQSRFVSMRSAVLLLSALFTVACGGGPVAEEGAPLEPEASESTDVSAQAYTCGETAGTCAPGYKCCYPCGVEGCPWQCMAVNRCPFIP